MLIKLFNKTWDTQEKESKKEKTQEWDNTSNIKSNISLPRKQSEINLV